MMDTNIGTPNSAFICELCRKSVWDGVESVEG